MDSLDRPPTRSACSIGHLVLGAALITFAVTLLRLILEGVQAPAWLANRNAGGAGALIGIAWLPLLFGPWFAARLRTAAEPTWPFLRRLLKVLVIYGWAARVPVVIVTFLALGFGWDTHFSKFGPRGDKMVLPAKIAATLGAQLIFWSVIWTPLLGGIAGLAYHVISRRRALDVAEPNEPLRAA